MATRTPSQAALQNATLPDDKPKKMALWKKIALGIVGFIALAVGLALWATSGVVDTVERQLAALRKGDIQAAYAETSMKFREVVPFDKFEVFVKQHSVLAQNASSSFNSRSMSGNTGEVKGSLTDKSGAVIPAQYKLVKENGAWRILHLHLGPEKN